MIDTNGAPLPRVRTFVLKIASRCNLNCSYCYVYNKRDTSWQARPHFMPMDIVHAALGRIAQFAEEQALQEVRLTFHGGEPMLMDSARFARLCVQARHRLAPRRVQFAMQTNGTLVDAAWAAVLAEHEVHVGVSVDGPRDVHDANRVDHAGHGSYAKLEEGVRLLRAAGVHTSALCVIPIGHDPLRVHTGILALGFDTVDYLFPDMSAEEHAATVGVYGQRPVADFLLPLLDDWWHNGTMSQSIRVFLQIARLVLGGRSTTDTLGGETQPYVFIETDGSLGGLDVLGICEDKLSSSGLGVQQHSIEDYLRHHALPSLAARGTIPRPTSCRLCPEYETCGGGYLPHRYRRDEGVPLLTRFNHPSVWCADILALFEAMRARLGVEPKETRQRAAALQALRGRHLPT